MDVLRLPRHQRLSPSRIVNCARKGFMESLGYATPLTPEMEEVFEEGRRRHEDAQSRLRPLGLFGVEQNVTCYDPPIWGKVDGMLYIDNSPAIFEMKTTSKPISKIHKPFGTHEDQAQLYMYMTELNQSVIYYQSKGVDLPAKMRGKFFTVRYDPRRAEELLDKGRYMLWCVRERVLPLAECYSCQNPACMDKSVHREIGSIE